MKKWLSQRNKSRYRNPLSDYESESILFGTLPSFMRAFFSRLMRKKPSPAKWLSPQTIPFRSKELSITWIGHATFLIQVADMNILTDPVFGEVSMFFPRVIEPGIHIEALPSIDYVLISHNHWDHMDAASLYALRQRHPHVQMLVPMGDKAWFEKRGFSAEEYDWWQSSTVRQSTFTFLPAVHWSGRGVFDKNRSLWGSWMIQARGKTVYFAGDTAYGDHFRHIADEHGPCDIALLPIGPCEPKKWMARNHMNPERSVQAFHDLKASHFLPMHWGTFPFGNDQFDEPIREIERIQSTVQGTLHILKAGKPIIF